MNAQSSNSVVSQQILRTTTLIILKLYCHIFQEYLEPRSHYFSYLKISQITYSILSIYQTRNLRPEVMTCQLFSGRGKLVNEFLGVNDT